jgi:hypothetical protein
VLKDVAVIHEGVRVRCPLIEGDENFRLVTYEQRVFPTGKVCRRRLSLNRQDADVGAATLGGRGARAGAAV